MANSREIGRRIGVTFTVGAPFGSPMIAVTTPHAAPGTGGRQAPEIAPIDRCTGSCFEVGAKTPDVRFGCVRRSSPRGQQAHGLPGRLLVRSGVVKNRPDVRDGRTMAWG